MINDYKLRKDPTMKIFRIRISFETEQKVKKRTKWSEVKAGYKEDYDGVGDPILSETLKIEKVGEKDAKIGY